MIFIIILEFWAFQAPAFCEMTENGELFSGFGGVVVKVRNFSMKFYESFFWEHWIFPEYLI